MTDLGRHLWDHRGTSAHSLTQQHDEDAYRLVINLALGGVVDDGSWRAPHCGA